MNLQKTTIEKIESYGGRWRLIRELNQYSKQVKGKDKKWIEDTIAYINRIYDSQADIIADGISNKEATIQVLKSFQDMAEKHKVPGIILMRDIISFNVDYISKIKKLA